MKKSFVVLFLFLSVGIAYAKQKRVEVEGIGLPASKNAPIEIKKQEAFVAAFFEGVRKIAEKVGSLKVEMNKTIKDSISNIVQERIGEFDIDSETVIKDAALVEDLINVIYKGQKFVVKDFKLISPPVEFSKLSKWNKLPREISGIEIKDTKWDRETEQFTVKLAYLYAIEKVEEKVQVAYEQDNLDKLFLFPDSHIPNNTEGVFSRFSSRPWSVGEKEMIINIIKNIQERVPSFITRVTAYRPMNFYRIGQSQIDAWSVISENALVVSDGYLNHNPKLLIAHEMTHLIDSTKKISKSREWLTIYTPIREKIEARLQKEGMNIIDTVWVKRVNREYIAREEGLPTLYAATDGSEGLAECVAESIYGENPSLAKPIQQFLQSNIFSSNFKPNEADRHFHQGLSLFVQFKLYDAVKELDEAINIDPTFAWAYVRQADIRIALGNYDKAIEDYTRVTELVDQSNIPRIYQERANLWAKLKNWERAIADYSVAIKHLKLGTLYLNRGKVYYELKSYDKAISDFTVYINDKPNDAEAYQYRGFSKYQLNDFDGAIADLSKSISIQPENWYAFHVRGLSYGSKNEFLNAKKDLQEALRLNPQAKDIIEPWLKKAEDALSRTKP